MRLFTKKKSDGPVASSSSSSSSSYASAKQEARILLFSKYSEGGDRVGPSGIEKLCEALSLPPENIKVLVFAWVLGAAEQGYFSRDEWMKGLERLDATDEGSILQRLRQWEAEFQGQAGLRSAAFKDFYRYAFRFSRDPGQKSIDAATASAMLALVMAGRSPHVEKFLSFLEEKKIRGMNEDQWMSFLTFCQEIDPELSNYDTDGAWPTMLDDFYSHCTGMKD